MAKPLPMLAFDPTNWRDQLRHAITDVEGLERTFTLTEPERAGARRAMEQGLPISITPYYASLADRDDPRCPIRIQCVPVADEDHEIAGDLRDPLGEEAHTVAPNLVSRYPDRALLLATDRCSVYCRFCTRSRMVGQGGGARAMDALDEAFAWIEAHSEIRDVIVSGGDPLAMSDTRIGAILERLARIDHLDTVRVATRTLVTLPQRIDAGLAKVLRSFPATWVMTHFNHPNELTAESTHAIATLVDHGIPVNNQTVLLRGVNDDAATLEALFRGLVKRRARPYYLLQADVVRGTGHLRTPLARGLELMGRLQGRVSGIALPKFIVDTPGGMGKVPLVPNSIVRSEGRATVLRTWRGVEVEIVDPTP